MSEIRQLLASAQQAEIRGDVPGAIRQLRLAEAWYRKRRLTPRAEQMVRQIRRLGGPVEDDEVFGFGEALEGPGASPRAGLALGDPPRAPVRAEAGAEAWCSFCCRPGAEVGPLAAGPTGAFICGACSAAAGSLLGAAAPGPHAPEAPRLQLLPAQQRALDRLSRLPAGLALLLGPLGSGKSTLLGHLGQPSASVPELPPPGPLLLEVEGPLPEEAAARLLGWLQAGRGAVLATRGGAPAPALLLPAEDGPVPVHDTASLQAALPHLPERLLARVEQVVELPAPGPEALLAVARARLEARGTTLPEEAVQRLVELALRSPRGAHELAVLVARVPPGRYTPGRP